MTELHEHVVARLLAAQNSRDPAPLREPEAVADALTLLRAATPSPEGPVDLDAVAAVFWTFWFRHLGPEDPDIRQNMTIAVGSFGFLRPRAPQDVRFPPVLEEAFDPADPALDARFAYLVSSAHGELLETPDLSDSDRGAALERTLAWSETARSLLPEEHEGFVELTLHALDIELFRFRTAADPDALAAAARHARTVCERLPGLGPDVLGPATADAAALALRTVVDASRLLGEPSLAEVERLVAAVPEGTLDAEGAEGLRFLRALHAQPSAWPGRLDLQIGAAVAEAGAREHDAGRIACAVRRLRAALGHTPAGHPAHLAVTVALSEALASLAEERDDEVAAREAVVILDAVDAATLSNADKERLELVRALRRLTAGHDGGRVGGGEDDGGASLGPLLDGLRDRSARRGETPDITLETLGIMASLSAGDAAGGSSGRSDGSHPTGVSDVSSGGISEGRIARYRAALAGVPADAPQRYACVAVLAALTGLRAEELRRSGSAQAADRLTADARALAEEVTATAPPDGRVLPVLLGKGAHEAALAIAASTVITGEPDGRADPELARMMSQVSRMADVGLDDPANLDSDIAVLRELLDGLDEDDVEQRADLSAALGGALSSQAAHLGDPAPLEAAVPLLRYAREHASELSPAIDAMLARALTVVSVTSMDTEAAREAAVHLATLSGARRTTGRAGTPGARGPKGAGEAPGAHATSPDDVPHAPTNGPTEPTKPTDPPTDPALAFMTAHTELHNALQLYLFGQDPGQLDQAREAAQRMRTLDGGEAQAGPPRTGTGTASGTTATGSPGNGTPETGIRQNGTPETGALKTGTTQAGIPGLDTISDVYLDLLETVGPGGGPKDGVTDDLVDRCRRRYEAAVDPRTRVLTAMTLMRVLSMHALALRVTQPERARSLLVEAARLVDAVAPEAPAGWADSMRPFLALTAVGVTGGGRLPPEVAAVPEIPAVPPEAPDAPDAPDAPEQAPPETPAATTPLSGAFEALMAPLRDRLAGIDDPASMRDPRLPALFRAHGEIGAAAGALGRPEPRIDLALSHLEAAVGVLPGITDRGSDQESAEHGLTQFEGDIRSVVELVLAAVLVRDASARLRKHSVGPKEIVAAVERDGCLPEALPERSAARRAVTGPDVDRATELLERGRGLLLSRRMEARADLGELRSAHPELADEFERLTELLAAEHEPVAPGDAERDRLAKLRTSRALDGLVDRVRDRPGFDGFLRPLTAERLRALAADGPVVVLNHARQLCHAVVVSERSITALTLEPEAEEVAGAARRLREAVDVINARGASRSSPAELVAAGAEVRRTLSWAWHRIVRPVLEHVGATEAVPEGGAWPRIWWVPTGAFHALPLHAAQCTQPDCDQEGCGGALDTVVSSYVPGFQTLAYARARAERRGLAADGGALLVAAPEEELPGVAAATRYAAALLGAGEPLIGAAATREAVLTGLGGAAWAHFGCHAASDPAAPSGALLHLPSGESLPVLDICRARPGTARLAFLAACGTARTSERLSDEAIHITSAFLLAGFPTAVGTLWEIDSAHADHVTRGFYGRAVGGPGQGPALALHHSVRALRERIPERPHIWAAYVHAGA
ncbi:CHAT domain-containing protein [Streptomyces sp. ID05-47C]|uniref:CHAT domain-containing protein n=1 Tax=Streptomyces sp. ID05-47C TaxID=3028665 RepID=UPI0029B62C8C|nr:CHAT domain-containing protein [Streptomyces sp. ID05-47C]MDX3573703.1 CHAT domain-containing protein [Streptomyces sp. ID05-47C]